MIEATLDANVLVSGFPASGGTPAELVERWLRREYELIVSEHILGKTAAAWERPYWAKRYSPEQRRRAIGLLRERSTIVVPVSTIHGVAQDEEDDLVLATAVAGNADYLVTGDFGLQELVSFRDITILSPRQFLTLLEADGGDGS